MGGKGETVSYTREFRKEMGTLTPTQREELKTEITRIIDRATHSLTIIALVGNEPYKG
jgi:hypothetical protein